MSSYPMGNTQERFIRPYADIHTLPEAAVPTTPHRGITPETMALYGVRVTEDGSRIYPYYTGGFCVGHKERHTPKSFTHHWADTRSVTMWTPTTQTSGNRYLVIVEGEEDAMTVNQLTGYTTWSVPLGAPSAHIYLARVADRLDGYENVYILYDNDQYGEAAVRACTELLPRLKVARLPPQYKDPNDVLRQHRDDTTKAQAVIKAALWGATEPQRPYTRALPELARDVGGWLYNRDSLAGLPTGFHNLDALLGGHRGGEFNVIVGGTGVGKSYMLRQLAWQAAQQMTGTDHVMYISVEDPTRLALTRWMELELGVQLLGGNVPAPPVTQEEFAARVEALTGVEIGNDPEDLGALLKSITYQARLGCRLVVLDHLSVLAERYPLPEFTTFLYSLAAALKESDVCMLTAVHMSRSQQDKEDNEPSLSRVKNASAISQVAWSVIGVTRQRASLYTRLEMLKNSRTWGTPGTAHYILNGKTRRLEETTAPNDGTDADTEYTPTTPGEDW